MNDGHRTSTIARPPSRERQPTSAATPHDRPKFINDLTTPIERDKQLVAHRRGRLVVSLFAIVIALAIGAALFVLPIKSWLQQRDDLTTRTEELETLDGANDRLQAEVDRLQTDAGIAEAAREEIDYVEAGEQRISILPVGPAPIILPTGWPYDLVTRIVSLRQAEAAAVKASATTVPATSGPATSGPATSGPATTGPASVITQP